MQRLEQLTAKCKLEGSTCKSCRRAIIIFTITIMLIIIISFFLLLSLPLLLSLSLLLLLFALLRASKDGLHVEDFFGPRKDIAMQRIVEGFV